MDISPRRSQCMTWERRINHYYFRFEHYVIPGQDSATYVYRLTFDNSAEGTWKLEKVIRFFAE